MQTANIMVALGGDKGTTVPKYGVTASEIAVLRAIHGSDAVFDIEPTGDIERNDREEIRRLTGVYQAPGGGPHAVVAALFPGAAARAFHTIDELSTDEGEPLPDEFFKPTAHAKATKPAKKGKAAPEAPVEPAANIFEE